MSTPSSRISLAFSQVGHSYSHIFMLLYPTVVLALEPEFHKSYGELLVLMTFGNVLFGVGALPAGWLGDRWSASGMMVVFFVGTGLSSILTGFATGPLGLALGLSFTGLFASIYHPVGMAWLVRNAANRGRALGVNGIFGSLGVAGAPLIAGVLSGWLGWRAAFIVPGAVAVATGVALGALVRIGAVTEARSDSAPRPVPGRQAMVRAFLVLSFTMLCTGLLYQSLSTVLPKVFAERLPALTGGGAAGAGLLVSGVYLCATLAQLLGGHLADRYSLRGTYTSAYALLAPVLVLAASASGAPMFLAATVAVLLNTVAIPVENSLLSHYSPDKWRGTAFGAKFVLALGVSALGVPLAALIRDWTGDFYWYFLLMALLAGAVAAASLGLPTDRQKAVCQAAGRI